MLNCEIGMGPVAQLVEHQTCHLEVKCSSPFQNSRPVPTLTFQACMLVLLREGCTVSWLNAMEIPIQQKSISGNTSLTVHTLGRNRINILVIIIIKLQTPAQTKSYILE